MKQQNYWNNFTTIPDEGKHFTMLYKDTTFVNCKRTDSLITGSSPCGEIHLHTTTQMIANHDLENETRSKWRYE